MNEFTLSLGVYPEYNRREGKCNTKYESLRTKVFTFYAKRTQITEHPNERKCGFNKDLCKFTTSQRRQKQSQNEAKQSQTQKSQNELKVSNKKGL